MLRNKVVQNIRDSKKYFTTKLQLNLPLKHFLQKTGGLHLKLSLLLTTKQLFHPLNLTMKYTWMKLTRLTF